MNGYRMSYIALKKKPKTLQLQTKKTLFSFFMKYPNNNENAVDLFLNITALNSGTTL